MRRRQADDNERGSKVAIGDSQQPQFSGSAPDPVTTREKEKRKVPVSSLERSFHQQQGSSSSSEAAEKFGGMPIGHQRWLLSFPQALKQLVFGYADCGSSEALFHQLLRHYPELAMQPRWHKQTAIELAIQNRRWDAAKAILEAWLHRKAASPPSLNGQPLEFLLVKAGDEGAVKLLQLLVDRNLIQPVISKDADQRNIFHHCSLADNRAAFQILSKWVSSGDEKVKDECKQALSSRDSDDKTPLELAGELNGELRQFMNQLGLSTVDFPLIDEAVDSGVCSMPVDDLPQSSQTLATVSDIRLMSDQQCQKLSQGLLKAARVREFFDLLLTKSESSSLRDSQQLLQIVSDSELFPIAFSLYRSDSCASMAVVADVLSDMGLKDLGNFDGGG